MRFLSLCVHHSWVERVKLKAVGEGQLDIGIASAGKVTWDHEEEVVPISQRDPHGNSPPSFRSSDGQDDFRWRRQIQEVNFHLLAVGCA